MSRVMIWTRSSYVATFLCEQSPVVVVSWSYDARAHVYQKSELLGYDSEESWPIGSEETQAFRRPRAESRILRSGARVASTEWTPTIIIAQLTVEPCMLEPWTWSLVSSCTHLSSPKLGNKWVLNRSSFSYGSQVKALSIDPFVVFISKTDDFKWDSILVFISYLSYHFSFRIYNHVSLLQTSLKNIK